MALWYQQLDRKSNKPRPRFAYIINDTKTAKSNMRISPTHFVLLIRCGHSIKKNRDSYAIHRCEYSRSFVVDSPKALQCVEGDLGCRDSTNHLRPCNRNYFLKNLFPFTLTDPSSKRSKMLSTRRSKRPDFCSASACSTIIWTICVIALLRSNQFLL